MRVVQSLISNLQFPAMDNIDRHNRSVMLRRIKTYWLKGVLEESLHGAEMIDLGLSYRPSAVANAEKEYAWQQTAEYDLPLPVGTTISEVFQAANSELLILGEPGAGKTTMLLQLVSDLVAQAEKDEQLPMPVVFSLANWAKELTLADWLVRELSNNYELPPTLGQDWIDEQQFIPLLDGLDEVEQEQRILCAQTINIFRQQHPGVSLLVTARSQDYQAVATRLQLDKAIVLHPLSSEQIDIYLQNRGQKLAGLRAALQRDYSLRDLAQSPLMLSIMTLAYYRMPIDAAITLGDDAQAGRQFLFDVYVERMTRYRSGENEFDPPDTKRWLSWLAKMLSAQSRTLFFLENIQPNWLTRNVQRQLADRIKFIIIVFYLLAGLLAGLLGFPSYGWRSPLIGMVLGGLAGFIPTLTNRLLVRKRVNWYQIETVETLDWSWAWAWFGLGIGGFVGLLLGGLLTWWTGRGAGETAVHVPWWLLLPILLGAGQVLGNALIRSEVKMRTTPGQGIERSRRNGWLVGGSVLGVTAVIITIAIILTFFAGIPINLSATLPWAIGGILHLSISGGLVYGGLAALQHYYLLKNLQKDGLLPEQVIYFLDYAAERNLLRKVGGGYTFVHALLLDYFQAVKSSAED